LIYHELLILTDSTSSRNLIMQSSHTSTCSFQFLYPYSR